MELGSKSIIDYFKNKDVFSKSMFEDRLVKWIVKDDQVVENEHFIYMMSLVKPALCIPSRFEVSLLVKNGSVLSIHPRNFCIFGKELITDRKNRLDEMSIQAVQCLKSWIK